MTDDQTPPGERADPRQRRQHELPYRTGTAIAPINKAGIVIIVALATLSACAGPTPEASPPAPLAGRASTTEVVLPYAETTHRPEVAAAPTRSNPPPTAARIAPVAAAPPTTTAPTTAPPTTAGEYFANCTELRKKYPDGVHKGHPAYRPAMDRDGDNWACETDANQHG